MITKNAEELLGRSLASTKPVADEVVIVDDGSTDQTLSVAKQYGARIYTHYEPDLGKQKAYALSRARGEWALVLDADELLSPQLQKEIKTLMGKRRDENNGYCIPYQNHFLGKPLRYGGENYAMVRLVKKSYATFFPSLVHERLTVKGNKIGKLRGKIYHYSYRSLGQVFRKFTDYALREAREKKKKGIKTNLLHVFTYPVHMFWSRFITDRGYKDGLYRIPLDLGFAYMEFVTHWYLLFS